MIFSSNPLFNSLKVYIIIIILLVYLKPKFIYDNDTKKFRQFGINKGNTIFSLPVLSIFLAVILYIIFLSIDKLNNNNNNNKSNNNFSIQLPMQHYPIHPIHQIHPINTINTIPYIPQMQFNPQYYQPQYMGYASQIPQIPQIPQNQ